MRDLSGADYLWVIKVPTKISQTVLEPILVQNHTYTVCEEKESMYSGGYPLTANIIEYDVANEHKCLVVPYKHGEADTQYGFYEFSSKEYLRDWIKDNMDLTEFMINQCPEWMV